MNTKDLPISPIVPGCLAIVTAPYSTILVPNRIVRIKGFIGTPKTFKSFYSDYWEIDRGASSFNMPCIIREKYLLRIDGPLAIVTITDIDDGLPSRMK